MGDPVRPLGRRRTEGRDHRLPHDDRCARLLSSPRSRRSSASAVRTPARCASRGSRSRSRNASGEEGEGYRIALSSLETGRIGIAAQRWAWRRRRSSHGSPMQPAQELRQDADGASGGGLPPRRDAPPRSEAARSWCSTPPAEGRRRACLTEAAIAKLFASEAAERVVVWGTPDLRRPTATSPTCRSSGSTGGRRVCQIYEGTSDIQKIIIARSLATG